MTAGTGGYAKIEEQLDRYGVHYATTEGDSMAPLLHTHEKTVVLRRYEGHAGRNDVILFRRPDGRYVLHRVVKVTDTGYLTRGDNRRRNDAPVPREQVLAVMDGYYKREKYISPHALRYRAYVFFWGRPNPVRALCLLLRDGARRLLGHRGKG